MKKPNVIFVFADQWRAQAMGYTGNPTVKTPHLDALAKESLNFRKAVSGFPVCSPYRATFLTGQHALTHGVFLNDVQLSNKATSIAEAFSGAGYDTAYIGKWHANGNGRSNYIPPENRQGFDYWKVLECTHTYNDSAYYANDSEEKLTWDGYDTFVQTRDAQDYINNHGDDKPYFMALSWGPPHAPYETAPAKFKAMYDPDTLILRPNVPAEKAAEARKWLAGYYAHCTALDTALGDLLETIRENGDAENTLFVLTSDHGDMLGSQGEIKKQRPWEESIRVPFLLRYPALKNWQPRELDTLIDAPDIMPTLLGLCDIAIPETVEGVDFSAHCTGAPDPTDGAAVLLCPHPYGQFNKRVHNGREYRGLRTQQYTYVRGLDDPWLLYDNEADPYQLKNLVDDPSMQKVMEELEGWLQKKLTARGDEFLPGMEYVKRWGYSVDQDGTVGY